MIFLIDSQDHHPICLSFLHFFITCVDYGALCSWEEAASMYLLFEGGQNVLKDGGSSHVVQD